MLTNAKLASYSTPAVSDGSGGRIAGESSALDVRCCVDGIKRSHEISLGAKIATATSVIVVLMGTIPVPNAGARIEVLVDQTTVAQGFEIVYVLPLPHGHQSHYQLFVKEAA